MKLGEWMVYHEANLPPQVIPLGDLANHDSGQACWCRPLMDCEVLVHNSLDGREKYETGAVRLN